MDAAAARARKLLFYFFLLLAIILPLELIGFVYLGATTGQWAPAGYFFRHHFAQQQRPGCWWADSITPHPFMGFAYHRGQPCSQEGINNVGLKGYEFPSVNDPNFYDILVLGGSVAELFTARGNRSENFLESRLNGGYVSPNGKPFRLLNGAISAGREPMQLISLILFGDRADAVITIEGYNELGPYRYSQPLIEPAIEWQRLMASRWSESSGRYRLIFAAKNLAKFVAGNYFLSRSYTLFLTTRLLYTAAEKNTLAEGQSDTFRVSVPGFPSDWDEKRRRQEILRQYRRMLRLQRAIAREENMPYFAFIQPVPALYKRLTEREKAVVGEISYGAPYQELADGVLGLRHEGFPIASLLKILASVEKSIYVDNIHFEGDGTFGAGNKLMADVVADTLARAWRLERRK